MAEEFVGMNIAVIVVTASILLAGIMIGLGRAFGYKRIEHFGIDELIQSIINAAIIGAFAAIIALVAEVSASLVAESCTEGDVVSQLICNMELVNTHLFLLFQELVQVLTLLGYYASLSLDFGAFSISPFGNLATVSDAMSGQLLSVNVIMILIGLNIQISTFIQQNMLALIFPVGLILRTFFATRKVGGFLIALALGLYLFYPAFVLIFPTPVADINQSVGLMENFTNNSFYAPMPVIDLNDNYAIAGKIDLMTGRCPRNLNISNITNATNITDPSACFDLVNTTFVNSSYLNQSTDFSSDLTTIIQSNNDSISKSLLYSAIAPLFSFLVTAVFVKELGSVLGSEIGIKTVASI